MKSSSIRNLYIVGAVLIVLGLGMSLTEYELPNGLGSISELQDLVLVISTLGPLAGAVCIVIAVIATFRAKRKEKN